MPDLTVISLGAGVQSTTLLLMAEHGEIAPRPAEAIFADTQAEPREVYRHLKWLESATTIPIVQVTKGDLREKALEKSVIPAFSDLGDGAGGPLSRACTRDYKIQPLRKRQRELMKEHDSDSVTVLMGISLDEVQRMRQSNDQRFINRYPLIEQRMTRHDCLQWLQRHGYPEPPRSACTFCPYHSNHFWRHLRNTSPEEFQDAIAFDEAIRDGLPRVRGRVYLHRKMIPLREVDLSTPEDHGQVSMFDDECEGYCGI